MKNKLVNYGIPDLGFACIFLALLFTSCKINNDSPVVSCKFGDYVLSVPKRDLIFYSCDDKLTGYNILNIVPNDEYRIEIRSYNNKTLSDWRKPLYGSTPEDKIDNYIIFCSATSIHYNCGTMVSDYKIPFYIEWRNFKGRTKNDRQNRISEAKHYLDSKQTHPVDALPKTYTSG